MLRKNLWKVFFCQQVLYISKILFISVTRLSHRVLSRVKRSFIHRLKLGSGNDFNDTIGLRYFTTWNVIQLRKSVRDIVYLKCCLKWVANKSDFPRFEKILEILEMTVYSFLECLLFGYLNK